MGVHANRTKILCVYILYGALLVAAAAAGFCFASFVVVPYLLPDEPAEELPGEPVGTSQPSVVGAPSFQEQTRSSGKQEETSIKTTSDSEAVHYREEVCSSPKFTRTQKNRIESVLTTSFKEITGSESAKALCNSMRITTKDCFRCLMWRASKQNGASTQPSSTQQIEAETNHESPEPEEHPSSTAENEPETNPELLPEVEEQSSSTAENEPENEPESPEAEEQ
eukprot:CAMPEP_0118925902 /NCGR_PEP_ID=MMETSP1169-20130426/3706_1 /TAXON_ID=36882 /ORGANISM="Pyramimonas obovata, Strain CCMP722" /LENGTH=223 /DNA_ID=CAMNT_0006867325 /DNA_START=342 /DNA_END=1013 /DNA_ORIENTATION=-